MKRLKEGPYTGELAQEGHSRLRIVIINSYERLSPRVQNEVESLLALGHKVKVLNWNREPSRLERRIEQLDVHYIELKAPRGVLKLIFYIPLLYLKISKALKAERFDVIHCTHLVLLPVCLFISKRRKCKVGYDAYEMHAVDFPEYIPTFKSLIRKVVEFIENKLVAMVDYVLTIDSLHGFLERRYRRFNQNVEVLYNVPKLDIPLNSERVEELRAEYKGRRVLTYVGGITKKKGLWKALEALKFVRDRIPNVKLLFIGSLKESEEDVQEYIVHHGLKENLEFIQWLSYEEMLCYLEAAELGLALHQPIGIYKVVSKGNGRKFFSYMQASIPIVGPDFREVGLVVREVKCGILVDTTDSQQIADAIIYLLEHPEEARAMGRRGRRAVEEKYNWEIEKEKLLEVYQKLGSEDAGWREC